MKKVLIIEAQIKQYRAPFYALLNESLRADGIQLTVAYSDPPHSDVERRDTSDLPLGYGLKVKGYWLWPNRLLYQPLLRAAWRSDLVIVDQGNRFLLNHLLLPLSRMGLHRVAFWGLGENLQAGQIGFSEWYRQKTLNWVSWWFAYTKGTAKYLIERGVPASKITAVQNSVDTRELRSHVKRFSEQERVALRVRLGIPASAPVGIFCGMLDRVKSVSFLVESSRIIKDRVPNFHLIIVGGGPESGSLEKLTENSPWIHSVGPRFGKEKAEFMAISQVFLLPGRVGLAILDAFACGLPLLTTALTIHGPEAEYLEENVNGLKTINEVGTYAASVCSLLSWHEDLARLQAGARTSAEKYSIENMTANFRTGIRSCLGLPASTVTVLDQKLGKSASTTGAPSNRSGFRMTTSWDDGHPLDLRIAELLTKHGLRGTFYVPLENMRPTLFPDQIKNLSSAFEIGAHTVHHSTLTTLSKERARTEITESKHRLEEITGKSCSAFCFPRGRYAEVHLKMLGDAGYTSVRTVELLSLAHPRPHNGLVIIPTTLQAYPHSSVAYLRNAIKRFRYVALRNLFYHGSGSDWASAAISLLHYAQTTGGVFHLWGHSWEIEDSQQWEALDRVLAAMAEVRRCTPCVTNSELRDDSR